MINSAEEQRLLIQYNNVPVATSGTSSLAERSSAGQSNGNDCASGQKKVVECCNEAERQACEEVTGYFLLKVTLEKEGRPQ
ncbi:hypothetical protein EYF80_006883 [Liparis tanakae]|uniref:Uncharacterized protein n=1 Tax=Liparis tanakae TaxID=230148 RepID=A0A4Z2IYG7_9TELE|nr:hypothetical protein EYF80_006883 [Liparis tanakae]